MNFSTLQDRAALSRNHIDLRFFEIRGNGGVTDRADYPQDRARTENYLRLCNRRKNTYK